MPQISDDRIKHMHAVAEYMYANAAKYGLADIKEQLYVTGLLHDVGACRSKEKHAEHGYDILRIMSLSEKYLRTIHYHSMSPTEYCKYHGITPAQVPVIQILMWDADMHFGPDGTYMTLDECAAQRTAAWKALGKDVDMSDVVNFLKTYGKCTE
ncbi:HD domain-containing protein [Butyrivibrio sp.]|uniref:HD domain-containing protein n=1 Tax=Butyrivibrio sp. TaxID=28121 RepID=UPI0025BCDD31|nr:HD domain-containing protein [Butyrivibrio sp.]MBQ7431261.1 HD domain-containing protein [Butyrivibrio sp.]MBQ9303476.1 HD domain-containing protein [Butyrivibrio sp.]